MKKITVAITDKAFNTSRIWAAKHDTSISALVQVYLECLDQTRPAADIGKRIARARRVALAMDKSAVEPAQNPAPQTSSEPSASSSVDFLLKTMQNLCGSQQPLTKQTT
jgi:hypothetical protein